MSDTPRRSRCFYAHARTETRDGQTFGANSTRSLGTVPIEADSSPTLPFFRPRPEHEHDEHYCGCFGWD